MKPTVVPKDLSVYVVTEYVVVKRTRLVEAYSSKDAVDYVHENGSDDLKESVFVRSLDQDTWRVEVSQGVPRHPVKPVSDMADDIIMYEAGEMSEKEMIEFFQMLVWNGSVWSMQGSYGRQAQTLLNLGLIKPFREKAKVHKAYAE